MDFTYLIRVLMKRKWIIVGSAILAAVVAWSLTRHEPKGYRSSTRISTGYAIPDEIKINESSTNMFDAEVRFNNAINTWMSAPVISLLSYELILHDLTSPEPFRRLNVKQLQSYTYKDVNLTEAKRVFKDKLETMTVLTSYKPDEKKLLEFLDLYGYGYGQLLRHIQIYRVPSTDYIQTDGITENPELSAFMVNTMFEQFIRYYRNIRSTKSQESIDTLQSIVDKKKQELDEKNKILRGEGGTDVATESTSKYELISEFEKSLSDEKNRQTDLYFELRKVNQKLGVANASAKDQATKPPPPTTDPNNNEELLAARKAMNDAYKEYLNTNDKSKLDRYNQLKAEFNQKYAAANPNAGSGTEKLPDNRADLLDKKNDVEVSIEASKEKIKLLEDKINNLKAGISSASNKTQTVETLIKDADLAEKEYLAAKQRLNAATDIGSSSVNNFRQLQKAQPAIDPEPSKRMLIVGMAGAVTFMSVIVIIIFLVYVDSSIRTPIIFSKAVGLKLISMVNFMNLKNKTMKDIVAGQIKEEDKLEKKRNNVFRESIRKLRYEIETSGKQIFLFTSTKKGQGKTTLIQALSYSLSMSRKKILIIDTNFSNNDLTVQLQADPVLEKISNDTNSKSLIEKIRFFSKNIGSEMGEVFVIGSEGGDYTPSEVLPRENLLSYLHHLVNEFDYIFLEGPPLNDFSDSKELIQYVDGIVAVFSAVHVIKQIDKESIRFLKDLNGKFTGSVLNMIDLENINAV
jgi:succinoglycan biosynthesis transport protein ExoP